MWFDLLELLAAWVVEPDSDGDLLGLQMKPQAFFVLVGLLMQPRSRTSFVKGLYRLNQTSLARDPGPQWRLELKSSQMAGFLNL